MRAHHMLKAAFLLSLFIYGTTFAQTGEISITTSSNEARELFIKGRDKQENIEFESAAKLLDRQSKKIRILPWPISTEPFPAAGRLLRGRCLKKL